LATDPDDSRTLLYLGTVYEQVHKYNLALHTWRKCLSLGRYDNLKGEIEGKMAELIQKQLAAEARIILAQESALNISNIPDSTLAVLYFNNSGDKKGLDPLQKGIADMLITDLSKVPGLKVVERLRMQKMMEEMKLNMAGLTNEATTPRIGKLLGASRVIKGTFIDYSGQKIRIDAGIHSLKNEDKFTTKDISGKLSSLFSMEKKLVFSLIDELGFKLSPQERDEILKVPTENVLAFITYCKGLDYEDRGQYQMASRLYSSAMALDPNFTSIKKSVNRTQKMGKGPLDPGKSARPAKNAMRAQQFPQSRLKHLKHIGDVLNQRFLPGVDTRKTTKENNETNLGDAKPVQMNITVDLPDRRP